jgi:hypothetical protein
MTAPGNGGIALEGYGASLKAQGRSSLIVLGFLVVAGAIIVNGWLVRADLTAQTKLLTQVMANQQTIIDAYITRGTQDHAEIKSMCLEERFADRMHRLAPAQKP